MAWAGFASVGSKFPNLEETREFKKKLRLRINVLMLIRNRCATSYGMTKSEVRLPQ